MTLEITGRLIFCVQTCETLEAAETVAPLTFEGFLVLNSPLLLLRTVDVSDCMYQNTLYVSLLVVSKHEARAAGFFCVAFKDYNLQGCVVVFIRKSTKVYKATGFPSLYYNK